MSLTFDARLAERDLDVSFEVPDGGRLALLGPNGAGKSTVLALLAGTLVPDDGVASRGDEVLFAVGPDRAPVWVPASRRRLALLPQGGLLFPRLSALDNVAFGPRCRGVGRAVARAEARRHLIEVGAGDLADRRPATLSGGQAQRVALARCLAADPPMLLLDEPLAGIDAEATPDLRRLLDEVMARRPTILVTHDEAEARALCDHVVVLSGGRVVATGPTADVLPGP